MAVAKALIVSIKPQQQAARESGVSQQRISHANVVLKYAPELGDLVLANLEHLDAAYAKAVERKRDHDTSEERAAQAAGFVTFEAYCQERWGWGIRRAQQLMQAAEYVEERQNTNHGSPLPSTEREARQMMRDERRASIGLPPQRPAPTDPTHADVVPTPVESDGSQLLVFHDLVGRGGWFEIPRDPARDAV